MAKVIKSEAELKNLLLQKCIEAVANAEVKVYAEMAGNLNQFYSEYRPREYARTGALFDSLKHSGAIKTGNSVVAEVGFDMPTYTHGFVTLQDGGFGYSSWTDEQILNVVMTGDQIGLPHGGYADGTAIWIESIERLGGKQGIQDLLKRELKKQGL